MELRNKTENIILSTEVIVAENFFDRLKGLLGKDNLPANTCIIISPCKSIHTFFMKFTIDVIFIDKNYKVIEIIKNIKPCKTSKYIKKAWAVIEISNDSIISSKVSVGEELEIHYN
jgi:uncharacterized membrane protein (UPF0127 family)